MAVKRATIRGAVLSSAVVQQVGDRLAPFLIPAMKKGLEDMIGLHQASAGVDAPTPSWVFDLRDAIDSRRWIVRRVHVTDSRGVESEIDSANHDELDFVDGALAFRLDLCAPLTYDVLPRVRIDFAGPYTRVEVNASDEDIIPVFDLVYDAIQATVVPPAIAVPDEAPPFRVFIAYGGSRAWEMVRDYLRDAGFEVDAFTEDERAGQLTLDVVEEMIRTASVAVIVMTGADKMEGGAIHARQNVVHEAGFAQGAIGRRNTIILREDGVTLPTNVDGLTYIQFDKGEIHTTRERVVGLVSRLQTQTVRRARD